MAIQPLVFHEDNRLPSITVQVTSGGAAVNLTGCSARFKMRELLSSTTKVDALADIYDAANGRIRYDWAASDLDTPTFYLCWWEITFASGKKQDVMEALLEVRGHGPYLGDLCELAHVRQEMETKDEDRELDDLTRAYITAASALLQSEYERELAPTNGATRRFPVELDSDPPWVDLSPYDLRSVTLMRLDPDGSPSILAANVDYELRPIVSPFGVYTDVALSSLLAIQPTSRLRFGSAVLEIQGNWGFAAVPEQARRACIATVRSWLRPTTLFDDEGELDRLAPTPDPFTIPASARRWMSTFRRNVGAE